MPTIPQKSELTLVELAKRMDPKGKQAEIAEVLEETNEILEDLRFVEANNVTTHVSSIRKTLPEGSWRSIGGYTKSTSSAVRQITEDVGMLEAYSKVDKKLAHLSGNPAAFRKQEDKAFIQGLGIQMATAFIYGARAIDPASFNGLAVRFNAYGMPNVTNAGGTGVNEGVTSLWMVQHDVGSFHGFYPRGSKAGLDVKDLGEDTETTAEGERQIYRSHFTWDMGIMIRDYRAIQRVANIPVFDDSEKFVKFDNFMIAALNRMPKRGRGAVIYANLDMFTMFDILAKDKSNVAYGSAEVFGKTVTTFRGVPIRLVEAISSEEDVVTETAA